MATFVHLMFICLFDVLSSSLLCTTSHQAQQARKPRSYASLKLRPLTHSLTGVRCRATSVAKNIIIVCTYICLFEVFSNSLQCTTPSPSTLSSSVYMFIQCFCSFVYLMFLKQYLLQCNQCNQMKPPYIILCMMACPIFWKF